jgi:hypothetical protein
MAAYIREHGFSATVGKDGGSRYFYGARTSLNEFATGELSMLDDITGVDVWSSNAIVKRRGWTGPEVTDDAVAACLIAADIAECGERA